MRLFSFLLLISFGVSAQVENWGGPIERVENLLGMGFTCNDADRAEVEYIDCQIPTLRVVNLNDQMNFDQISEELIFMEATRRNHQFVSCQRELHDGLKNPKTRSDLKKDAYLQFKNIQVGLRDKLKAKDSAQETVDTFRPANFSEDRHNARYNQWRQDRLSKAQSELSSIERDVKNLVSRIPLGNREEVKNKMIEILKTRPNISESDFAGEFEKLLIILEGQVTQSENFFNGIKIPQEDGTNLYSVDDELKLSLIQMKQVDNVVKSLGMEERLSRSFVCRSRARYVRGPKARMAMELPFYFGAYGLGRLAVRLGGAALSLSARAGMIGLDIIEGARAINETMNACFPDEFLAGSLEESCTAESEISSVYQEAEIATCVTTGVLSVGSVAFVGGAKIWAHTRDRAALKASALARLEPEKAEDVIVVTGRRQRVAERAKAEPPRDPSKVEIPRATQNKINLSTQRVRQLELEKRDFSSALSHIDDPALRNGFAEAFKKMHDPEALADYIGDLQADTFRLMLASENSKLRSMAQWGKMDKDTMLEVLKKRVEDRGAKIVEIRKNEGVLTDEAFNERIGQGYLIDGGFPEGMAHGKYTHLLQQDFAYDIISRTSGKSHQEIIDFFGTPKGHKVWGSIFDNEPKMKSPNSPEFFRRNIMEKNIPLGFIPDKKRQSPDTLSLPA